MNFGFELTIDREKKVCVEFMQKQCLLDKGSLSSLDLEVQLHLYTFLIRFVKFLKRSSFKVL